MLSIKRNNLAFDELRNIVRDDLDKVNILILEQAKSDVTNLIPTISDYITSSGGKRIRPILTLACAKVFELGGINQVLLATAVEFIHTATLLHDDVIDESNTRRGVSTANTIWGNKASILVGDYLFSQAFKLMVNTSSIRALNVLSKASATISEGEVWQLTNTSNFNLDTEDYFKLIRAKTAELFSAACEVGAVVANAKENEIQALASYGMNLGMVFQIVDDVLDYTSSQEGFGKKVGIDFREGKITLPLIIALREVTQEKRNLLENLINNPNKEENFQKALDILQEHDVFNKSLDIAREFIVRGLNSLHSFQNSKVVGLLKELLIESINRTS
jgi:octaprenyl-diphosphate synthase